MHQESSRGCVAGDTRKGKGIRSKMQTKRREKRRRQAQHTSREEAAQALDPSLQSGFHDGSKAEDVAPIDVDFTPEAFQQEGHDVGVT